MTAPFRIVAALITLTALAACGVDGAPIAPSDVEDENEGGISITGTAEFGVAGTL